MRIVLASASPRRRELLHSAGIEFDVDTADVDESVRAGESPSAYVERLARWKAETVAARHPGRVVIGSDTTVVVDGDVLGKPVDSADAGAMLRRLSGRGHDVLTAVAVVRGGVTNARVDCTRVYVKPLTNDDITWYVSTGEPMDKAGGYAIQGHAARFIDHIDGAHDTVVGLPVALVLQLMGAAATDC